MKTFQDVIDLLEDSTKKLYAPIVFSKNHYEWFPIDKQKYIRVLKFYPPDDAFFSFIGIEEGGKMFIHPKVKNK